MFIWLAPDMNLRDYLGQRVDASEVFCAIYQAFGVTVVKTLSVFMPLCFLQLVVHFRKALCNFLTKLYK